MFQNNKQTLSGFFDGLVNKEVRITLTDSYVTGIFLGSDGSEFKLKNISYFTADGKYIRYAPEQIFASSEIERFELKKK